MVTYVVEVSFVFGEIMKILSASSTTIDSATAAEEVIQALTEDRFSPKLLLVYHTVSHSAASIYKQLKTSFPDAGILASSICHGAITDTQCIEGNCLSVLAIDDDKGSYGAAVENILESQTDVEKATCRALDTAISRSKRLGELPKLVAIHATPGNEERILSAVEKYFGVPIPIIGGSAASDSVDGNWSIFDNEIITQNGIGVAVLYPNCQISYSFHCGYAATGKFATATKVNDRILLELDGNPAEDKYRSWFEELNSPLSDDLPLFEQTTFFPLGRIAGKIHNLPYYKLSHPSAFTEDGGIELFTSVKEGEVLYLMRGTEEQLVARAGRVVNTARDYESSEPKIIGGLAIYCAGCMLQVKNRLSDVASNMRGAMQGMPFVCAFTFGEQGQFAGGETGHGNLMISAVLFHKD